MCVRASVPLLIMRATMILRGVAGSLRVSRHTNQNGYLWVDLLRSKVE